MPLPPAWAGVLLLVVVVLAALLLKRLLFEVAVRLTRRMAARSDRDG